MNKKAAGILLFNNKNEVLLFSRAKDNSGAGVPGGKVEEFETPLDAAMRECLEETGIEIISVNPAAFVEFDEQGGYEFYTFYATEYKGSIKNLRPNEGLASWGSINELINGPFSKYNSAMLEHFGVLP